MRAALIIVVIAAACSSPAAHPAGPTATPAAAPPSAPAAPSLIDPREVHFAHLKQLSAGGENAEAYWSTDGKQLIFQTTRAPYACDQIMRMPADGSAAPTLVSTGKGRTTCSYFTDGNKHVLFASTHGVSPDCPPGPDRTHGYVWSLYDYDIYAANPDGGDLKKLNGVAGAYDAEATVCAKDGSIIFTSDRDGDLELYRMNADGSNVVRLTHTPGYDGGAFFSADCSKIVWRASRPTGKALDEYKDLLAKHLVKPTQLELYVADADGSDARQVTYLNAASFGPYFFPSGKRIIFASNHGDPKGREFDLWAIDSDGTNLERITYTGGFDGFPMFSPDGKQLVFASNRHPAVADVGETDLFLADWIDAPPKVTAGPAERFRDAVAWLADDARGGRKPGSPGNAASATWIEEQLRAAGVLGGAADGKFRQPFDVTIAIARGAKTALAIDGAAIDAKAFTPVAFSGRGDAAGAVIAAGFGISAPELKVDDYKGKNVKGKVVLVHRFVPADKRFDNAEARGRYGDLEYKAFVARQHGAVALVVVDDGDAKADEAALPALEPRQDNDAGIPIVALTRAAAAPLAKGGTHTIAVTVDLGPEKATTDNVIGVIRAGAAAKKKGVVVIGAHYDHLGLGGPDALDTEPAIHNGADDNASGVAALLEVARTLAANQASLARDVYVVAFSGEEMGDLGSAFYVKHPPTAEPVVAMLNMDMVGRMRADALQVLGSDSAAEWGAFVQPACDAARVLCTMSGSGYGPSDHMSFYAAGAPVLHFFTGGHLDYHKASDDADKINAAGGAQVAAIVADVAARVDAADPLTYKKVAPPPQVGDVRARGASLGTIPSYSEDPSAPPGVVLSDVVPDGAAQKAGLKAGDRIVDIGGTEVRNVHDLMFVLTAHKPGEKTRVTYVRDGKRATVEAVFGAPRSRR
jgi:Tol biopolymer transport system component